MRLIIAGSRSFHDYDLMCLKLDSIVGDRTVNVVISGTAAGADTLGERWAEERGIRVKRMPADWNQHGKRAGYLRNVEMAHNATHLAVFWDGESKGTAMMLSIAREFGLPIYCVRF